MKGVIPTPVEITREAIVLIAGAILAAAVLSQLPQLRAWINAQLPGRD